MNKIKFIVFTIFISGLFSCLACAAPVQAEQIDNFAATITVQSDASLAITERIDYDFGSEQRHGIYRNIPVRYSARGGNYNLRLSGISVKDAAGGDYKFEVTPSGNDQVIKIGDADTLVSGKQTYILNYTIGRAINYFSDHDELYWNATGSGWTVPIAAASAQVLLPHSFDQGSLSSACFAGPVGSTDACAAITPVPDTALDSQVKGADFTAQQLEPGEGLTVVVGLPVGSVYKPSAREELLATLQDNAILFLPVLVFLAMFALWWKRGRDPKGRGTIIPEYDVPDSLTPGEVGTIVDEKCGQKEVVAEIIELAVGGYLKLHRQEKKVLFVTTNDYTFEKLKDGDDVLSPFQRELLSGIFKSGDSVKFSELKQDFFPNYDAAVKSIYASVSDKGYFAGNPRSTILRYMALIFLPVILVFVYAGISGTSLGAFAWIAIILSAIIIAVFAAYMPRRTEKGVLIKEYILGLEDYLTVAEKDRLEFHNAPKKDPQQFEKLLPYAIALGVEQQWAKQFEGIYNSAPSWYDDPRGLNNFSALYLVSSLGDFGHDFAAAALPPSASGGGSGLGGGGFSGGGFGGGGGGSW
jgi:uncharacterized membrane protein